MHPEIFVERLADSGATFPGPLADSGFPAKAHQYAEMITSMMSTAAVRHAWEGTRGIPIGAFAFPATHITKRFGRGGEFDQINDQLGMIAYGSIYSERDKVTKPYWLTGEGHKFVADAVWATAKGHIGSLWETKPLKYGYRIRKIRKRKNGISSLDNRGKPSKINGRIRWATPINIEGIEELIWSPAKLENLFPDTNDRRLRSMKTQLALVYLCACNDSNGAGRGFVPQVYIEDQSGRLNSLGGISLQNLHKELRPIVLADTWEYDMENCHWRILQQKVNLQTPEIDYYVKNCKEIRQQLGEDLKLSEDPDQAYEKAKGLLLKLLFGAQDGSHYKHVIPRELGKEKAAELYAHTIWKGLRSEVDKARAELTSQTPLYTDGGRRAGMYVNVRDKGKKVKGTKLLAHILQGWEAEILAAVIAQYGQDMVILQHDGWGTDRNIDKAEFEALIERRTKLEMSVECKPLEMPGGFGQIKNL